MKKTYDVYDIESKICFMTNVTSKEIQTLLGVQSQRVSDYCSLGKAYHRKYRFEAHNNVKKYTGRELINIYDFQEDEYLATEVEREYVMNLLKISNNSIVQHLSTQYKIGGRYLIFRAGELPKDLLPTEEKSKEWDNARFSINPAAQKAERVS